MNSAYLPASSFQVMDQTQHRELPETLAWLRVWGDGGRKHMQECLGVADGPQKSAHMCKERLETTEATMGAKGMESTLQTQEVEMSAAYTNWMVNPTVQGTLGRNSEGTRADLWE